MILLSVMFLTVQAGNWLQLIDYNTPLYVGPDQAVQYTTIMGDAAQFENHDLGSKQYTITAWVQETAATAGTFTIFHFRQKNMYSVDTGFRVPILYRKDDKLIGQHDGSATIDWETDHAHTLTTVPALYQWTQYVISVCGASNTMVVCATTWRGTYDCGHISYASSNLWTFKTTSYAYLGGSIWNDGFTGKIVDVRYYDTSCISIDASGLDVSSHSTTIKSLVFERRCAHECSGLCFGPDTTSCTGFQILHPYYYEEINDTQSSRPTYKGTDIEFKGHALNSAEMSVSTWVYPLNLDATDQELWRFASSTTSTWTDDNTVGHRMLTVHGSTTGMKIDHGVGTDPSFEIQLTATFNNKKWLYIGASISQTDESFTLCAMQWGSTPQCTTASLTSIGTVHTFKTTDELIIASNPASKLAQLATVSPAIYLYNATFQGRFVDFRFFPDMALSDVVLKEFFAKPAHICAPSCEDGGCWGPDTGSCKDYIQLTDPRFSEEYASGKNEPSFDITDSRVEEYTLTNTITEVDPADANSSNTYDVLNSYSVAFWIKGTAQAAETYIIEVQGAGTGSCTPCVYINASDQLCAKISVENPAQDPDWAEVIYTNGVINWTSEWNHITVGITNDAECLTFCVTNWDSSTGLGTPNWSNSITNWAVTLDTFAAQSTYHVDKLMKDGTTNVWLPQQNIPIGEDSSDAKEFTGRLVDVRFYPQKTLVQADAEAIVGKFGCIGDQQCSGNWVGGGVCEGPDDTSVIWTYLTEKNFEYTASASTSPALGTNYWQISGSNPAFLKWDLDIRNYQVSVWSLMEDTLAFTYPQSLFTVEQSGSSLSYSKYRDIGGGSIELRNCIGTSSLQCKDYTLTSHESKTYYRSWVAMDIDETQSGLLNDEMADTFADCYIAYGDTSSSGDCNSDSTGTTWTITAFSAGSNIYLGGDTSPAHTNAARYTNLIFYPDRTWTTSEMQTAAATHACDIQCNENCYGPGINSCLYDDPLQISDDSLPFVGDGLTAGVTLLGTDRRFENHFMQYKTHSICTWFQINNLPVGKDVYLIAIELSDGTFEPVLSFQWNVMWAGVAGMSIETLALRFWYYACVSDGDELEVKRWDGTLDNILAIKSASEGLGRFNSASKLYYGGYVRTGQEATESYFDGKMFNIQFYDTKRIVDYTVPYTAQLVCSSRCGDPNVCTGPTQYDCDQSSGCASGYYQYGTECLSDCPDGTYAGNTQCLDCDSDCSTCAGASTSDCLGCNLGKYLLNGQCKWEWDLGTWLDTSNQPYTWLPCNACWATCNDGTNSGCITAANGMYRQPGPSGECATDWPSGYAINTIYNVCDVCDPGWLGGCTGGAVCSCRTGTFKDQNGACIDCSALCATCANETQCTSCVVGYIYFNGFCLVCTDFSGFGGDFAAPTGVDLNDYCTDTTCGDGIVAGDEECDDGNLINGDGCSQLCKLEGGFSADGTSGQGPKATMEFISRDGDLYKYVLYFDSELIIVGDFSLSVELPSGLDYTLFYSTTDTHSFNAYSVDLTITSEVPSGSEATFFIGSQIFDYNGFELQSYEIEVELEEKTTSSLSDAAVEAAQFGVTATVAVVGGTIVVSSVAASSSSSTTAATTQATGAVANSAGQGQTLMEKAQGMMQLDMSMVWSMIEVWQFYSFMIYMAGAESSILSTLFDMLQFANGDFIPNVFEYFILPSEFSAPAKFAEQELDTNFLLNGGGIILAHMINGITLAAAWIGAKIFPNKPIFANTQDSLTIAAPVRIAIEGALELCLAVTLQFRNLLDPNMYNIMGCVGCLVCIIGYFVFIHIVYYKVVLQPISVLEDEDHQKHYGGIYEGYKLQYTRHKAWILVEIFRKMLYVALLVLLTDHPKLQISSLVILQFAFFGANAVVRPFESDTKNYLKLLMEGGLLGAFICFGLLINEGAETFYIYVLTMIILGILIAQIGAFALYTLIVGLAGLAISAVNGVVKVTKKIKEKCSKKTHTHEKTMEESDIAKVQVEVISEDVPIKNPFNGIQTREKLPRPGLGGKDHLILFE